MKKTVLTIATHSFVDLITNSSSELFVCDTEKTLEMVKEVVEKITRNYYDEMDEPCPDIWGEVFSEPKIAKTDLDESLYPNKEDIAIINDWAYFKKEYQDAENIINAEIPIPEQYKNVKWEDRNEEYKAILDARRERKDNILRETVYKRSDAARKGIEEFFGECSYLLYYGVTIKKGNIILESAEDNSIPYEIWDRIESVLNAQRYHLG